MLVDFIDLRCSVSVPFLPSSLSPQDFAVPASSFLSELKGCMPAGACIHCCFHCTEHLIHCCTVLTQILRKSVALLARFHVFLNALKCLKMHALTQVLMLWKVNDGRLVHDGWSIASFDWFSAHPGSLPVITALPNPAAERLQRYPWSTVLTGRLLSVIT